MSTRCQVIIKDKYDKKGVWFYRHSDGYPEGTMPALEKFLGWVKQGRIRDNSEQAAGWLVIIGHNEYKVPDEPPNGPARTGMEWKVGAFEPCEPTKHGDIDYLYTVDLTAKKITYKAIP
jgi:hypothetical protein